MKIIKTKFSGLLILKTKVYKDKRGYFKEVEKKKILKKNFIFDCFSFSKKNTLRGLHLQLKKPQAKIITVVYGKILDVVVDLRKNSKSFGKWISFILSDTEKKCLFVPRGFAHGYITLTKNTELIYFMDEFYSSKLSKGIVWNDSMINVKWPFQPKVISEKDKNLPSLKNL